MGKWQRHLYQPVLPLGEDGRRVTGSEAHIALSRKAAGEGMVLLKNEKACLPLTAGARVALFGKGTIDYVKGGGGSGDVTVSYVRNLYEGMKQMESRGKVELFHELPLFYEKEIADQYAEGAVPGMTKEPVLPEEMLERAKEAADVAVVTFCRFSGEGWDRVSTGSKAEDSETDGIQPAGDGQGNMAGQTEVPEQEATDGRQVTAPKRQVEENQVLRMGKDIFERGDFYLTKAEEALLEAVCSRFARVIVVMNVGGMVDSSWFKGNDRIGAVLMAWQGGMEGGLAAAEVLCGDVNPSGRLADTFAASLEDYPSTAGFHESDDYVDYTEDIYVGYRYFETIPGAAGKVNYPFGFGLSYTDFDISVTSGAKQGDEIVFDVQVKNTGGRAGKEVVQIYFSAPQGKLGKPARVLAAFRKTKLLEPGETVGLRLAFSIASMASYDDTGKVCASAYVLEPGEYAFYIGRNVRDAVKAEFVYRQENVQVTEQLTSQAAPCRLARRLLASGEYENLAADEAEARAICEETTDASGQTTECVSREMVKAEAAGLACPEKAGQAAETAGSACGETAETEGQAAGQPCFGNAEPGKTAPAALPPQDPAELEGVRPAVRGIERTRRDRIGDRPQLLDVAEGRTTLDDFVEQLSDDDRIHLLGGQPNTGVANTFGMGNLPEYGVPNVMTADGPAGLRIWKTCGIFTTAFPCATLLACTWDPDLAEQVGAAAADELKENNLGLWLAPAVNIHRSPLCGRNFEYYSEDPLLAGKVAAAMVRGIQSKKIGACAKHFACNNKETNRKDSDSRVSERALREIYLKAFEIIVKESQPYMIMTSYNLINGVQASENKDLLTGVLRGEWGYTGLVTTDWWTHGEHYREIKAGNDVKMGTGYPERVKEALEKGLISREEITACARRVLEMILKME